VFSQAEIWFSLDGDRYQPNPIRETVPADRARESARNITVQLRGRPAKFIKLRLSFADKWILLSEVSFESGKQNRSIAFRKMKPQSSISGQFRDAPATNEGKLS
jgi:hypothetical protein